MVEVKVLIEGYTSADSGEEKICATISLIKDGDNKIVVDPGVLENQKMLVDKLKEGGLSISDITAVFLTHSHIDHYRNIGMFPEAKTLEYYGLWDRNTVRDYQEQFSENIRIIKTPGHSYDALTFLVKTADGVVAVCGDVFWEKDLPEEDIYASDKEKLKESRKIVLESADWIIPGHAGIYKAK
ncbi:MAG: MBL fold metallo-hydrolase [Candidatus Portnoybacteria bacterium]|nr:MBL fold metallo-hydrolase [Candidatus Portnoybacteria bacterium]MDD4982536.1 MBL fold metallo-hydrolase [Candidatus Portnoybacteria bacterium]